MDRYNGQCFVDVKTATQKKKVAEVRQSPAIFFSVGQIVQLFLICSSITVLYGHVTRTLYIDIHIYSVTQYTPSVTILNVLYIYIYTHIIYIYISSVTQYTGVLQY